MTTVRTVVLEDDTGALIVDASTRELDPAREYWLLDDGPTGWDGGTGPKGNLTDRLREGAFPERRWHGTRGLELRLRIKLDSYELAVWEKHRLGAALADGRMGMLTVDAPGIGPRSTSVQRDGEVLMARVSPHTFDFSIPLLAPDPHKYGPWRSVTLRPAGAGIGLEFPIAGKTVVTFGSDARVDEWVWNEGTAPSLPRFTVVANSPAGFRVGLGDRMVTWPQATFVDSPVVVDMAGSITVSGVDQSYRAGERSWSQIEKNSIETPRFELLGGGTGFCTVAFRDTDM